MSFKKTMDGNAAAAHIAYAFSEVAGIYPITPSSTMADSMDLWQTQGKLNIFGNPVKIVEMQSEAGVAGFVHGALKTGAFTSTFTSSQGLLLMLPNMYKIAGELLPTVFHVAARSVTTNALSIFGDHSDVMSVRQSGFAMLAESSVQEVMDLSAVAHLSTLTASVPFVNFFDGFGTSHELQKINVLEYEDLKSLIDEEAVEVFRSRAMNPNHPLVSGTNQGPDLYFQQRETVNRNYQIIPYVVKKYMDKINSLRGTNYDLVSYYGDEEAEEIIVSMGSVGPTIEQTVDYLNANGRKVGFINVHLYRPFPAENFLEKIPQTVKAIAVLDRTKEAGATGEPLLLDIQSVLYDSERHPKIIGGRYGLGSKDTSPNQIVAVFDELQKAEPKKRFTIGIHDDVTHLSLTVGEPLDLTPPEIFQSKFFGLSSDGLVSANKSIIKIIGDHSDKEVQAYFYYDSKKQTGLTVSHLRFGNEPIKSSYFVQNMDFVALSATTYLRQYDVLKGLKRGGTFLLNTSWTEEEIERNLPNKMKKYLADFDINFYVIDAKSIAQQIGLDKKLNTCMEAAFFKLTAILPLDQALSLMKESIVKLYGKHSKDFIEKNKQAVCLAIDRVKKIKVLKEWQYCVVPAKTSKVGNNKYVFEILQPLDSLENDSLSVGKLIDNGMITGEVPLGTSAFEKRNMASEVPVWNSEFCIQCNSCSFVCPHAAIRPFLAEKDELNTAPDGYQVMDFKGKDGLMYRIQVSVEDCTGCGLCVEACPRRDKALKMMPYDGANSDEKLKKELVNWAFSQTLKAKENPVKSGTVKATQFEKPLLEFSGACPGCGETPYVKLLTQMFGDRMVVANATGCSSIWGGSTPSTPYCTNKQGQGPAWSNSLLEDNAEFGYGMMIANDVRRKSLATLVNQAMTEASADLQALLQDWLDHVNDSEGTRARSRQLEHLISAEMAGKPFLTKLYEQRDLFVKPSQWIIGGDGWAYDIGYGGIDHVLASGADVNMLVLDNEVYANTGGQVSKGTPASAIAKFVSSGKQGAKKDLGMMAMTYGNIYVAQIANGANAAQTIKAFEEAERYPGPSLIIAYVPCITHGLKGGLRRSLQEAKEAVASGYWSLYRFNPLLKEKGQNPMILDYKKPQFEKMTDFMLEQQRFSSLVEINPLHAQQLFAKTLADAKTRFMNYSRLSGDYEQIKQKQKDKSNKKSIDVKALFEEALKD